MKNQIFPNKPGHEIIRVAILFLKSRKHNEQKKIFFFLTDKYLNSLIDILFLIMWLIFKKIFIFTILKRKNEEKKIQNFFEPFDKKLKKNEDFLDLKILWFAFLKLK